MTKAQPLDNLAVLAKAGVPVLHVCGSLDPMYASQTQEAEKRYKELGATMTVIVQEGLGHYPTAPKDPKPVVDFIVGHQRPKTASRQPIPDEGSQVGIGYYVKVDYPPWITWNADADFESGIRGFLLLRDGAELAKVPQDPVGRFGRPLFQNMTYHDTPAQPLSEMRYLDTSARPGEKHVYAVVTINSLGLKSEPSPGVAPENARNSAPDRSARRVHKW